VVQSIVSHPVTQHINGNSSSSSSSQPLPQAAGPKQLADADVVLALPEPGSQAGSVCCPKVQPMMISRSDDIIVGTCSDE
jgi:hypothetical protein